MPARAGAIPNNRRILVSCIIPENNRGQHIRIQLNRVRIHGNLEFWRQACAKHKWGNFHGHRTGIIGLRLELRLGWF
jgi:hypothetical protein